MIIYKTAQEKIRAFKESHVVVEVYNYFEARYKIGEQVWFVKDNKLTTDKIVAIHLSYKKEPKYELAKTYGTFREYALCYTKSEVLKHLEKC